MKIKTLIISFLLFYGLSLFAQQPPQTVVFKVRKAKKGIVVNEAPPEEIKVEEKKDEAVFRIVEEPATFQGGDIGTFRSWVQQNIVYPADADEAKISGKVIVQFAVDSKGKVVDAKVLRGIHPSLDKEAISAVMNSPRWLPGKQGGKAVKQQFVIPIIFQLQ